MATVETLLNQGASQEPQHTLKTKPRKRKESQ